MFEFCGFVQIQMKWLRVLRFSKYLSYSEYLGSQQCDIPQLKYGSLERFLFYFIPSKWQDIKNTVAAKLVFINFLFL